jgi:phosphoketolase
MALAHFAGAGSAGLGPILLAFSIVVVPSGMAGIRVSEMTGTVPGTLYPGVHFGVLLVEDVALFDTRDQVFTTGALEDGNNAAATDRAIRSCSTPRLSTPSAKEGLTLPGLRSRCVTVSIPSGWTRFKATWLVR